MPDFEWTGLGWVLFTAGLVVLCVLGAVRYAGPVLRVESLRTARRGRFPLFRGLYALLLLIVLFVVYAQRFHLDYFTALESLFEERWLSINEQAAFARSFFYAFLPVQFVTLLVLTPALTAGAITEEKEKGTLAALLVTHLTPTQIVLGKLFTRYVQLVLLLLTGVPNLAILQVMGGIDMTLLIGNVALTLLSMLSLAAFSLIFSVSSSTTSRAVVSACVGYVTAQFEFVALDRLGGN